MGRVGMSELSLNAHRDAEEGTALMEMDKGWWFIDSSGHEHRYGPEFSVPTCRKETSFEPWDGFEPTGVSYYCNKCGEEIFPGLKMSEYRQYHAGPREYSLNGLPITEDEYKVVYAVLSNVAEMR